MSKGRLDYWTGPRALVETRQMLCSRLRPFREVAQLEWRETMAMQPSKTDMAMMEQRSRKGHFRTHSRRKERNDFIMRDF